MDITVTRRIDRDIVRNLCIQKNYYTRGDVREYDRLLDLIPLEPSDKDFEDIAYNIYRHSDIDRICGEYGCDEATALESILFELYNASWTSVTVNKFEEGLL